MADSKKPSKSDSNPKPAEPPSESSGTGGPPAGEGASDTGTPDGNAVQVPTYKPSERDNNGPSAEPPASATTRKKPKRASSKGRNQLIGNLDKAVVLLAKAVAFGLVAGAVGVFAAIVLRQYDDASSEVPARIAELSGRLEALEERVTTVDETAATAAQSVASELERTRSEIEAINSARTQAEMSFASATAAIEDRLAKLEAASREAGTADAGISERLEMLEGEVASLEERLASSPPDLEDGGTLAGADSALDDEAETVRVSGVSDLRRRVAALESASSDEVREDRISQRLDVLDSRISALEELPADESTKAALEALVELETLSRQVETLLKEQASREELTPRALALIGVRAAAEVGAPFMSLLEAAGIGEAELPEILVRHGETGVATMADLRDSFPAAARSAQQAANAEGDAEGIVEGFRALFRSAVQVRPLEPVDGDDVPALLSRAEAMVRGNMLAEALDLLAALPEPSSAAIAEWLGSARARLDVLAAIDGLLNETDEG